MNAADKIELNSNIPASADTLPSAGVYRRNKTARLVVQFILRISSVAAIDIFTDIKTLLFSTKHFDTILFSLLGRNDIFWLNIDLLLNQTFCNHSIYFCSLNKLNVYRTVR